MAFLVHIFVGRIKPWVYFLHVCVLCISPMGYKCQFCDCEGSHRRRRTLPRCPSLCLLPRTPSFAIPLWNDCVWNIPSRLNSFIPSFHTFYTLLFGSPSIYINHYLSVFLLTPSLPMCLFLYLHLSNNIHRHSLILQSLRGVLDPLLKWLACGSFAAWS